MQNQLRKALQDTLVHQLMVMLLAASFALLRPLPPPAARTRARSAVLCTTDNVVDVEDGPEEFAPPKSALSWQEELEKLLSPDTPNGDRDVRGDPTL